MQRRRTERTYLNKIQLSYVVALSVVVFSANAFVPEPGTLPQAQPNQLFEFADRDRIIVKYKTSMPESEAAILSASSMQRASQIAGAGLRHMRRLATDAHLMKTDRRMTEAEFNKVLANLATDPNVEYVEPDILHKPLATPTDSRYNEQWHYFEANGGLNLPTAWDTTSGEGIVIAVIDTGSRPHADLDANLLPGYDMISDIDISQDGDGRDSDASDPGDWAPAGVCAPSDPGSNSSWHGTHVAGTVAAVTNNGTGVAGVAYGAKVVPVRVLGRCGGYTSDIADGMIWAAGGNVTGVPANTNPAQVLNLSLGGSGTCSTTQQVAINTARSLGATVVVAAGNSSENASNSTPANCSGVVTVASVDRTGGRAWYSNFGSVVDVAAPGGDTSITSNGVLSTLNEGATSPGNDSYAFYQGTSMAAPHVAGATALMYAVDPTLSPDEVESILKSTARSFPASCSQCGSGIVDASAAVDAAGAVTPIPPPPGGNALENGVAQTGLKGSTGDELAYTMDVPAGATDLSFQISGGTGDADLYVRFGAAPTTSAYDCRPYLNGNVETCNIGNGQAGTYHVMVRAYSPFSDVSLLGSYAEGGSGGVGISETNLSGAKGSWQHFTIDVAPGASSLKVVMSGSGGDADLYVRDGSQPTTSQFRCRPYITGNNETCAITTPRAGTWHVSIRGYSWYSGVNLEANAN